MNNDFALNRNELNVLHRTDRQSRVRRLCGKIIFALIVVFAIFTLILTFGKVGIDSAVNEFSDGVLLDRYVVTRYDEETNTTYSETVVEVNIDELLLEYGEADISLASDGTLTVSAANDFTKTYGNGDFDNSSKRSGWSGTAHNSSKSDWSLINRKYTENTATVYVAGGFFTELRNKGYLQYQCFADWNKDRGDWEDGRYAYYNGNRSARLSSSYGDQYTSGDSRYPNSNWDNYGWTGCPTNLSSASVWAKASVKGLKAGVTVTTDINVRFRSTDSVGPTIRLNTGTNYGWAQSKQVYFYIHDYATKDNTGTSVITSSGYMRSIDSKLTSDGGNNYHTTSNVTGNISLSARDGSYNTSTYTFTAAQMHIDLKAPTVDEVKFCTGGSTTKVGTRTTGTVDLLVKASDTGESGVKNVRAYNKTSGVYDKTITSTTNGYYTFSGVPNGVYTIVVTDNAGRTTTKSNAYCYYGIDATTPTVSATFAASSDSATGWKKDGIAVTFTVTDRAGKLSGSGGTLTTDAQEQSIAANCNAVTVNSDYAVTSTSASNVYTNNHGISSLTVNGPTKVDGTTGALTVTTSSASAFNSSTGKYTATYTVTLPITGTYTFNAKDKANNAQTQGSLNGTSGSSITTYIDTVAPRIDSVTVSNSASTSWTSASSITITISMSDDQTTITHKNKGSRIKSARLVKNTGSGSYDQTQNFEFSTNKSSVTFTVTANYDSIQNYKIILTDFAGNTSDSVTSGAKTFNGTSIANYFRNENTAAKKIVTVLKDSVVPQVRIYSDSSCSTLLIDNSNTAFYVDPWGTAASRTFYVKTTFGASGSKVYRYVSESGKSATLSSNLNTASSSSTWTTAVSNAIKPSPTASEKTVNLFYTSDTTPVQVASDPTTPYATTVSTGVLDSNGVFLDAVNDTSHLKSDNTCIYKVTVSDQNLRGFRFICTNGAGVSTTSGVMFTRMDRDGPSVTFLGFTDKAVPSGTYGSATSLENIIKANGGVYYSESQLYSSDWISTPLKAILLLSDSYSGVSGNSQYYGKSTGPNSQTSLATVKMTFKYGDYTYTMNILKNVNNGTLGSNIYPSTDTTVNGKSVLSIPLFNYTDSDVSGYMLRKASNGSTDLVIDNTSDESLRINWGSNTPFTYNITVHDFGGKEKDVTNAAGTNLQYKVDPFPVNCTITSITAPNEQNTVVNYDSTPYGEVAQKWTRKDVTINITKTKMGLSETRIQYGMTNIIDPVVGDGIIPKNANVQNIGVTEPTYTFDDGKKWKSADTDSGTSTTSTIVLKATARSVKLYFKVYSKSDSVVVQGFQSSMQTSYNDKTSFVCVRQDNQPPRLKAVFFSTDPDLLLSTYKSGSTISSNILLYYEAKYNAQNDSYTFERKGAHLTDAIVWSNKKVYAYIIATDMIGDLMGCGVKYVKTTVNSTAEYYYTLTQNTQNPSKLVSRDVSGNYDYVYMYRSAGATYGYTGQQDNYGINFELKDDQNNSKTFSISVAGTASNANANYVLFPYVDTVVPKVSISSATYGGNSYLSNGRFNGTTPIRSAVSVTFNYVAGISDSWIYIRKRDFGVALPSSDSLIVNNSNPTTPSYGFIASAGISISSWSTETVQGKQYRYPVLSGDWTYIGGKTSSTATPAAGSSWLYEIPAESIYNRYDILIVNGAGVYYYMDGGDVFIDNVKPTFDASKTFLSLASDTDNDAASIDYSKLSKPGAGEYTNDDVWAYFYVTDGPTGSGVASVYKSGTSATLEKVTLVRDGVTYSKDDTTGGYYRIKLTSNATVTVQASDVATNESLSTSATPYIDKNSVSISLDWKKGTSSNKTGYTPGTATKDGAFTNAENVYVTITVGNGASGFSHVDYIVVDHGASIENATVKTLTTSSDIGANIHISGEGTQTGTITFQISAEQDQDYYFRAYNGVVDSLAVGGTRPVGTPLGTAFYNVRIDKTAPTVDTSKGNYNFLTGTWHFVPQQLQLSVSDPNDYGSGVSTVSVTYDVGTGAGSHHSFSMYPSGSLYVSGNDHKLDHYVNYTVTMTDGAENSSTLTLLPKIDSVTPTFTPFSYEVKSVPVGQSVTGLYLLTSGNYTQITDAQAVAEEGKTYYNAVLTQSRKRTANDDIYVLVDKESYTPGGAQANWTNMNVETLLNATYGISGAILQYRRVAKNGTFTGSWLDWGETYSYGAATAGTDDGKTKTKNNSNMLFSVSAGGSSDYSYQIRIKSNAVDTNASNILYSEIVTIGRISIDKEKPLIEGIVRTNGNNTDWGTPGVNRTDISDWTQQYIYITMNNKSGTVSGYSIYYNVSQTGEDWKRVTDGFTNTTNFSLDYSGKTFLHTVTRTEVNNETYQYYIESGSGMRSDIYTVAGVKIDNVAPSFSIEGKESSVTGTPQVDVTKLNTATENDYPGQNVPTYNLKNPVWTKSNSVIICVSLDYVNISGVTLKIDGKLYETFNYADYVGQTNICRYYVVSEKKDLTIEIKNGAGKQNAQISGSAKVWIDNVIPMIYVTGITGTKSSNWDDTIENSWYVTSTSINFKVGTLVKSGDDYVWSATTPSSGYKIFLSEDAGETWFEHGTQLFYTINGNPSTQGSYRVRVVSGSGMVYTLGDDANDNNGALAASAARCTQILSDGGLTPSALRQHLSDSDSYLYNVNVDSNNYYILNTNAAGEQVPGVKQMLTFVDTNNRTVEVSTMTDFATYTYQVYKDSAWQNVALTDLNFKRGDLIRVSYISNSENQYVHSYTEYGVVNSTGTDWESREYDGHMLYTDSAVYNVGGTDYEKRYVTYAYTAGREQSGTFEYRFTDSSLRANAHFIKLLDVNYSNVILYKQTSSDAAVTATTSYTYKNASGATTTANIPLTVSYKTMSGTAVTGTDLDLGGYLVEATVAGSVNAGSFRLKQPMTVLLVKYFAEKLDNSGNEIANSVSNPYSIYETADLQYVSASYYDGYVKNSATSFTLNPQKSYLSSSYRLRADLTVTDNIGIAGEFSGSFDGTEAVENNTVSHVITMAKNVAIGSYGFFEEIAAGATVHGLVVTLADVLGVQAGEVGDPATVVGILAAQMTGGTVYDVRVCGEIAIASAKAGALIGGVVGELVAGRIGGNAATESVFADVRIDNNGTSIDSANIGGVVGSMGETAVLNRVYAYTAVTIYNVGSGVKVGAMIGSMGKTAYAATASNYFYNNRYLATNTFVNDEAVAGFAGVTNDVTSVANTVESLTYEQFIDSNGAGATSVVLKSLRSLILDHLYLDFGVEPTSAYTQGNGAGTPFKLDDVDMLLAVGRHMNVNFVLTADLDLSNLENAIGLHKVYNGNFDGNGKTLSDFGAGYSVGDGDRVGLFADLSGSVTNFVLTDVALDQITSLGTVYAGVIAAKLSGGTIGNIIAIGNLSATASNEAYVGAIAGYADGGVVYDIFSIVNAKATASSVYAGGVVAHAIATRIGSYNFHGAETVGTVFALGRAEASSSAGSALVGAAIGSGSVTADESKIYAVRDNAYSNGVVTNRNVADATLVDFGNTDMRTATFSNGLNVFGKVFNGLYRLEGNRSAEEGFTIRTAEDFAYIEQMLYAKYNIANDITFTNFKTIGVGLVFSGSINGKNSENWSAETGTVSSLMNVTDALVYNNSGTISDFGVNVYYSATTTEDVTFGAIAVYNNNGTIRNVTVGGEITVNAAPTSTVIVSGFIGVANGGVVANDNKVQNSISGLVVTVNGAGMVYAGGYVGEVDGEMTLTYGIGSGTITLTDCSNAYAGALVGAVLKDTTYKGVEATTDYRYTITVNGNPTTDLFGYVAGDASTILHIDEE